MKILGIAILWMVSLGAMAAPQLSLEIRAEKDATVERNGETTTERVPADEVEPGKVIYYTLEYRNDGDEAARNVQLKDKLPDNTLYIPDSAWGEGARIEFSIDDASTFKQPSRLTYEVVKADGKAEMVEATVESYTHIRWTVDQVPVGAEGQVGYSVRVE